MGRFLYGFMTTQKRPEYVYIHTQKETERKRAEGEGGKSSYTHMYYIS